MKLQCKHKDQDCIKSIRACTNCPVSGTPTPNNSNTVTGATILQMIREAKAKQTGSVNH